MYYSQNREKVSFEKVLDYINGSYEVYNISFKSKNFLNYETKIYGNLYLPIKNEKVPGLVYLPGGGMTKKQASHIGYIAANLGYAALIIDQRGIGETGGIYLDLNTDYQVFSKGNEPIQHLSVYDGLRSIDLLRENKEIDKNNIAISGESMGGRYAIIAASLDKRIKGLIVISSGGFNFQPSGKVSDNYLLSIDPDHYISDISPRPIIMIHGDNDTVVPLALAQNSFNKAGEPKKFYIAKGCSHGYCDKMYESFKMGLKDIFGKLFI
jgi:acetyl esterase/lipase